MPYIGRDLSQGNYLKLDSIESQFNGSKVSFALTAGGSAFFRDHRWHFLCQSQV